MFISKGYTVLELVLILFLIALVLQCFPNAYSIMRKTTIIIEQQKQFMQRFESIYYHMKPFISLAGSYGCASDKAEPKVIIHGLIPHSGMMRGKVYTLFKAHEQGWFPPLLPILQDKVAQGADAIIMESAGAWQAHLKARARHKQGLLPLSIAPAQGGWFVISDCKMAELFEGEVVNQGETIGVLPRTPLSKLYDHSAMLSPWQITAFYLDKDRELPTYSLKRKILVPSEPEQSLIRGIEGWALSIDSDILQVNVFGAGEPLTVWVSFDNARG